MSSHGHDHAPSHAPKASSGGGGDTSSVLVEGAFGGVMAMFMGAICLGVQSILGGGH